MKDILLFSYTSHAKTSSNGYLIHRNEASQMWRLLQSILTAFKVVFSIAFENLWLWDEKDDSRFA